MLRKLLSSHGHDLLSKYILSLGVLSAITTFSQTNEAASVPKFLGAQSCGSSSCHGGAASNRQQVLIWSRQDFHTRAYATLTSRRSEVLAEALKLGAPATNARCTTCHAPFHEVPSAQRAPELDYRVGVSCESCHGPAEAWLRSHTRSDFSHADRVAAGMRDLKNLYVRANTCVACHQNIDAELLRIGHPELIFELDGQAVTQPKHWRESEDWDAAQAWLVGQAVALRELSWKLEKSTDENAVARWQALVWLLQNGGSIGDVPAPAGLDASPQNVSRVRQWGDNLAKHVASLKWSTELTKRSLSKLAATHEHFTDATVSQIAQARRAERLVLALDRLWTALNPRPGDPGIEAALNELFNAVQSLPDFKPSTFSGQLRTFNSQVQSVLSAPEGRP